MKPLTDADQQKVQLLLQFLDIARKGTVKPFDPIQIVRKIEKMEREGSRQISDLKNCCPPSSDVADCKDFRPYILATLDEYADIMGLDAEKYKKEDGYTNRYR